jgi:hypothetical protein
LSYTPISKSEGIKQIRTLVEKFEKNYADYTKGGNSYNESQTRADFIDPFFESLGWDLKNRRSLPNYTREVILEDSIEGESTHQNPDYGFQAGTEKKFFVEAKKSSVRIESDKHAAFQARSYGWTDKHPIVLLTNFEYLSIYDTTVKPNDTDDGKVCRIKFYHYKDYESNFDEIHELLSRESIFSGQFDQKVAKLLTTSPSISPDQYFLEQINRWRIKLASNLHITDQSLTETQINDIVQKFINRIIFLRICEDRTLEDHESLLKTAKLQSHTKFLELLKSAEIKYDSDLFESAHSYLPLTIDSQNPDVLEIIEELYYPKSPFSFRVIESNVLGSVYEMFLTQTIVIKKINGKPDKIDLIKKPEDKNKALVSTPAFIIRKIVEESLGEKIQGRNPVEIPQMKILDPASGSGSFLVESFQYLIDYVTDWYVRNGPETKVYEVIGGWRLTLSEKIKLLNCIKGVDIDFNAVEVTKFALCIKLLEHETGKTISTMTNILPKLSKNILCGNSIVDNSIWDVIKKSSLDGSETESINCFDWKSEFYDIKNKKFDVIIGNPPYMKTEDMKKLIPYQWQFFKKHYSTAYKQFDKYYIFIQKGLELLDEDGKLGYIVPHKFMKIGSGKKIRKILANNKCIEKIIDFGTQQLFKERITYTCMIFLRKGSS